jgi:hypothetical protein
MEWDVQVQQCYLWGAVLVLYSPLPSISLLHRNNMKSSSPVSPSQTARRAPQPELQEQEQEQEQQPSSTSTIPLPQALRFSLQRQRPRSDAERRQFLTGILDQVLAEANRTDEQQGANTEQEENTEQQPDQ